MRGRYPAGPEYVDHLEGSAEAKRRAKVILQTLLGDLRVQDACSTLGICPQRFHQLRDEMLQAAVARLEARPAGRPRHPAEVVEVTALQERLADMEDELQAAQVRAELAVALPGVVQDAEATGKKSPSRPKRQARPGWWKKG